MSDQNTISDSKEKFHKEFPYVIPPIYRRLTDELLVELHLATHRNNFKLSNLYALGIISTFNDFTAGYRPERHLEQLFNALCISNGLKPSDVREKSDEINQISKQINCNELNKFFDSIEDNKNKILDVINTFNIGTVNYSRIAEICVYKFHCIVREEIEKKETINGFTAENLGKIIGFPGDKIKKDINIYQGNIKKMEQALELLNLKKG